MGTLAQYVKNNRLHFVISFIIICFLLFFSTWQLSASPATWFDEGINLSIAKSFVQHGIFSLETAPGQFVNQRPFLITTNYPVIAPAALFIKIFGAHLWSGRLAQVLFLWIFCLVSFLLVKKIYSPVAALASLALVVTFAPFYGNGKVLLGEVPGLVFFITGVFLMHGPYALKKFLVAGLMFGLALASKPFFLIIAPAVLAGELFQRRVAAAEFWKRTVTLGVGVLPPLVVWAKTILVPFSISTLLNTARFYSNSYAASGFSDVVATNFFRFFHEVTPIHFAILEVIVIIGFSQRLKQKNLTEVEVIIAAFVLLNVTWYLKTPGWYRYFFPSHLLIFLFFPAILLRLTRRHIAGFCIGLLVTIQLGYLITKGKDTVYYSPDAVNFTQKVLSQTKPEDSVFILNTPSIAFLLQDRMVFQMLQINPVLFFGKNSLRDDLGNWYPYVVISGSVANTAISHVDDLLRDNYEIISNVGKYLLYKKNPF